ncbi:MAG: endopeptidase La [Pseudomonadota bacterium]
MGEKNIDQVEVPSTLPLLPVKDVVLFPSVILPLFVGRESSIQAVDMALAKDRLLFLAAQRDLNAEVVTPEGIHKVGCVGMIMRMHKLPVPDGRIKILVQGIRRARVREYVQESPSYMVSVEEIREPVISAAERVELEAMMRTIKEVLEKIVSHGKILSPEILIVLDDVSDPGRLADLVASYLGLKVDEAQPILEMANPRERLKAVLSHLHKELDILSVQQKIQSAAKGEMTRMQREYYLREQLRAIKNELGDTDSKNDEVNELRDKIQKAKMPPEVEEEAIKQLKRLEGMHQDAAEASIVRTYLDWLIDLPWVKASKDNIEIEKAHVILDEDHFDLEKVKDRILEYLGVTKLRKKLKGPILYFIGPPGVGKTSLGKSIARSMGRQFVRFSLGGMRDEAELRGHRRTYVGAMPGRIIQGIKQAGTRNPVYMLDEVDKLGNDFRGDPSSALLEVLDPEQNFAFRDHYINLPFDLSNTMFIATANLVDPIPPALRDRMEIIYLPGYIAEEKVEIAHRYLMPKQMEENGISDKYVDLADDALAAIIEQYTREAGLRNLEREIASIFRKVAKRVAEGHKQKIKVTAQNLHEFLGPPKFFAEGEQEKNQVGVATGLAWTASGGEILFVEATVMKGKGTLTLTGHLGDVMKESARAALSYARSNSKKLGIKDSLFQNWDIHIHVPAGAIPKDGPSAGVTMATALVSALTGRAIKRNIAMTGEITLRGRVLPVGGIKEKVLAARRAKLNTILIPELNMKDLVEIPKQYLENLKIVPMIEVTDVLEHALEGRNTRRDRPSTPSKEKRRRSGGVRERQATM